MLIYKILNSLILFIVVQKYNNAKIILVLYYEINVVTTKIFFLTFLLFDMLFFIRG